MPEGALASCPSAPHRAVAGLVRVAAGGAVAPGLAADIGASDPGDLAAIANVNNVHTALGAAFAADPALGQGTDPDLILYFDEMQRANAERNAAIGAMLEGIGSAFTGAGIDAAVLKGSAELLSPTYGDPAHRFLSDCDLLVAPGQLHEAMTVLVGMGGVVADEAHYDTHHHAPPVTLPGAPTFVELHRRVGNGAEAEMLPPEDVLGRGIRHPSGLIVPDPVTRMVHLIAHGHLSHMRHGLFAVYLRDVLDFAWMTKSFGPEVVGEVAGQFREHRLAPVFGSFAALAAGVVPETPLPRGLPGPRDRRWVARALRRFGSPRARGIAEMIDWARVHTWRFLTARRARRRYLAILAEQGLVATVLGNLRIRGGRIR